MGQEKFALLPHKKAVRQIPSGIKKADKGFHQSFVRYVGFAVHIMLLSGFLLLVRRPLF